MRDITEWNVESDQFWEQCGKRIAYRNLWFSASNLMCGFAVWLSWSIITVQMLNLGFPFSTSELFSLMAVAGLSCAALRIPSSFFIRLVGGRNAICFTTGLLMLPSFGLGMALQSQGTPFWVFQFLAVLSGIGGGNFASSMANISAFFPRKSQGFAISLNAGLGSFGIILMQVLVPLVVMVTMFGGTPMISEGISGNLIGRSLPGTEIYIHNAGYVWLLFLVPMVFASLFGMNNIRTRDVSPRISPLANAFSIILVMLLIGIFATGLGLYLLSLGGPGANGFGFPKEIVLLIVIATTVWLLRLLPGEVCTQLDHEYRIFNNKHTWVMSIIYTMTFGSFIGFSTAFALCIKVVFGYTHIVDLNGVMTHNTLNTVGPTTLMYAWMGPFVGILTRPVGTWMASKVGGALVTGITAAMMTVSILVAAYYLKLAYQSGTPDIFFIPFFLSFLVLFGATGIGNGSSLHTISIVFDKEQMGATLGWASAIAAFGAFYIPMALAEQIELESPEKALYGFAAFYIVCILINGWFYLRKNCDFYNP